jgi:hypothetical protein
LGQWPGWTQPQKQTSNIVGFLVYLVYGLYFFFYLWKYKSGIKIPGFSTKCCKYIYIYIYIYIYLINKKKMFSCLLHTANTLTYSEFPFLYIKKINIWSFENVFSHGFLKHDKKLFSCIYGFYNMFVKLQRALANIPKKHKNLILGEFIYYSPLMFG